MKTNDHTLHHNHARFSRRINVERNDQERQAMMDQQMKGMTPQVRQQHMEMMRQQCK